MKIRDFLPADSRSVEFVSSLAMIAAAVFLYFGAAPPFTERPALIWVVILLGIGGLQLIGTAQQLVALRAIASLSGGVFWMWIGLSGATTINHFSSWWLGLANLMAFVIIMVGIEPHVRPD